ncbi:MAG: DUF2905 domain-containing protein [Candidatus Korobacteraceae bacterium]
MAELGKTFLGIGLILMLLGAVLLLSSRLGLPIGRLPGDLQWRSRSGHTQVYFPLATSIIVSLVLTLILWLLRSFRR